MRKLVFFLLALAVAVVASCDDGGPTGTDKSSPPSEYSGTFDVDFKLDVNTCAAPPPMLGFDRVTVADTVIEWGGIAGTWDETAKRGRGTSDERCVPIQPPQGCAGCYVITYDITFASPDSFSGTVEVPYDYTPECNVGDCLSSFTVTGVRR